MRKVLTLGTAIENEALAKVASGASQVPSIIRIVAFGSRVRGDFSGNSDLDLLVLVDSIEARPMVVKFLYGIETEFDVSLAPVIYTVREFEINRAFGGGFVANVEREGVILYDAEREREN